MIVSPYFSLEAKHRAMNLPQNAAGLWGLCLNQ